MEKLYEEETKKDEIEISYSPSSLEERTSQPDDYSPSDILSPLTHELTSPNQKIIDNKSLMITTPTSSSGRPGQVCAHCSTTVSPLWRRTDLNEVVCNACGLYYKNRGHKRPIELKMAGAKRKKRTTNINILPSIKTSKRRRMEESLEFDDRGNFTRRRKLNKPLKPSKLSFTTLNDILSGFRQTKFYGRYYHTGDVVIIRGNDGNDYYVVISGFSVVDTEKYFRCFWLVPKPSSFLLAQERHQLLTPLDYDLFTDQEYQLPMHVIKAIFYSSADTWEMSEKDSFQDDSNLLDEQEPEHAIYPMFDDRDTADALLLVRFSHATWAT